MSCSQPINAGNVFGALELYAVQNTSGDLIVLGAQVEYRYVVTNNSDSPAVKVRGLAEVLNGVNAANLDQEYKAMYRDYLQTGILDADVLADVGETSRVRYLAQLSLAGFSQGNRGRFSFFGLRMLDTKQGNLRIFLQIWDAESGTVVWEGSGELNFAYDTGRENPVTFAELCRLTAERLFAELPGTPPADTG